MSKKTMNLRVDSQLKKNAENIISQLGISMSSAITLYLRAIVREKGIPFPVTLEGKKKTLVYRSINEDDLPIQDDEESVVDEDSIKKAIDKF
ncbi:MAG: type II toxin-antitoxin system RelB/DinJ family antitoxin [Bacilli bacterium]